MTRAKRRADVRQPTKPPAAKNASWVPGRKGQGGEGYSKGYGGSAGRGVGPSGPENAPPRPSSPRPRKPVGKGRR